VYTVWFMEWNQNTGKLAKVYDLFSGTRSECYRYRKYKQFRERYRVEKNIGKVEE